MSRGRTTKNHWGKKKKNVKKGILTFMLAVLATPAAVIIKSPFKRQVNTWDTERAVFISCFFATKYSINSNYNLMSARLTQAQSWYSIRFWTQLNSSSWLRSCGFLPRKSGLFPQSQRGIGVMNFSTKSDYLWSIMHQVPGACGIHFNHVHQTFPFLKAGAPLLHMQSTVPARRSLWHPQCWRALAWPEGSAG